MVKSMTAEAKYEKAEYEKAKTSVWWDIERCPIPKGCKAEGVAQKISSALRKLNYSGDISIFAYGNMDHIPPSVKKALSSTGVQLNHVDSSYERGDEIKYFSHMLLWTGANPAPANLMFISRDEQFFQYRKREEGFNILLAHPPHPSSDSFVASANTTWLWKSILEEPDI